jgi:two-component system chemotaxis response regulator CheB
MEPLPIRVLIVDDSAFMRLTLTRVLNEATGLVVVGVARDGQEALELIPRLNPDVITLDVEMPRLDGLSTLRAIMAENPRAVVMLSSLTNEGAHETILALALGAVDFVAKPEAKANIAAIGSEVVTKIRRAAGARVVSWSRSRSISSAAHLSPVFPAGSQGEAEAKCPLPKGKTHPPRGLQAHDKVVVIGASTGGPRALHTVLPMLPAGLPAAVLVVQHMPPGFTRSLAERLDSLSALRVKEAAPGDRLQLGLCLLAPGGFHMQVDRSGQVGLNQNPAIHGVRPAVDVTMTSTAQNFGANGVGVVLTGMGRDGANGAALIHSAGGRVIAEDESTCVVWGMPRSVVEAGAADWVVPLEEVAGMIERAVKREV